MFLLATISLISILQISRGSRDMPQPYESVKSFFGVTGKNLPRQETMLLIRNVLYRVKCDQAAADCKQCLNVDSVFRYLNRSGEQSLEESSFKKLSVILVVFMTDVGKECSQSQTSIESRQLSTSELYRKLTRNKPKLSKSTLVDILKQISRNYRFGSLVLDDDGYFIPERSEVIDFTTNFKCFGPQDLYKEMKVPMGSDLNASEIPSLAGYVVWNVLQGHCISIDDKPSPYSFLADLFSLYGDKAKAMLDHEEFENLLEALNLNSKTSPLPKPKPTRKWKRDLHGCQTTVENLCSTMGNMSAASNETSLQEACPARIRDFFFTLLEVQGEVTYKTTTLGQAYGFGALAVGVISISPLGGVVLLKLSSAKAKSYIMCLLMAVAIAALTGDAVLHLLPQALGIKPRASGGVLDGFPIRSYILKMAAVLGSFYTFIVLQMAFVLFERRNIYDVNIF
ncbi:zinc transporter ZIP12-like [Liolophura sinensis]|uniref:zinc transporter ZIP12-like n=1 Tax=Liolophura sinensis TaxID=3198878 RepID=UPI0031593E7B